MRKPIFAKPMTIKEIITEQPALDDISRLQYHNLLDWAESAWHALRTAREVLSDRSDLDAFHNAALPQLLSTLDDVLRTAEEI
jgi:hypothetical protein